ncbi:hypothetical protein [Streptomyces sp. NPDC051452]|uniref:hypothetical protein n=1 Tax=Streptomyces sp. NPDC051452 TaxID=3365654 RepID=UPI0037B9A116
MRRAEIRDVNVSLAARSGALTIRSHRPGVGGWMRSVRQRASSSTRALFRPPPLFARVVLGEQAVSGEGQRGGTMSR